ncbi:MAG TPA: penicillin-binding protein 1A [Firmicutes bacterium]|nr:penicillin-binding protein 1A [Bacillota bacterium]
MTRRARGTLRVPFLFTVLLMLLVGAALTAFLVGCVRAMPRFDPAVLQQPSATSTVYDGAGKPFTRLHAEENRLPVDLKKVPRYLQDAFIATEDVRFRQHHGVDPKAIARAAWRILTRQSFEGGSTITQQLVKNVFLTQERTLTRKVQEALLALQVERRFTKDQILAMYLNQIYFGHGAYGVQAASRTYFGKDVSDLTLAEAALLAGLTKNPSRYSPYENLPAARERQAVVLDNMVRAGFITQAEAAQARSAPLKIVQARADEQPAPYFIDYVISYLVDQLAPKLGSEKAVYDSIYRGGLQIYTTIDPKVQKAAEAALEAGLPQGEKDANGLVQPQGALVAVDPGIGAVRALVGGRDYAATKFNRAVQALRQPGSSFKPFVYTTALAQGWSPGSVLDDAPMLVQGKIWPDNYDHQYRGLTTLRVGIARSINVMAVKLMQKVGVDQVVGTAEKMGITSLVKSGPRNDRQLALALGGMTDGVSPLQMASAYAVLANGGLQVTPHPVTLVKDANGNILWQEQVSRKQVLTPQVSYVMTDMLKSVITSGTGGSASLGGRPAAGKTGTTSENNDVWFVGYTPDLSAAVWIGSDAKPQGQRTYLSRHGIGSGLPARIWGNFMRTALAGTPVHDFPRPGGLVSVTVCSKSGLLPSNICPPEDLVTELFIQGTEPTTTCDVHVTATVCSETGQLATEYCPQPVTKVFIKRQEPYAQRSDGRKPADAVSEVPTATCTKHTFAPVQVLVCPETGELATPYCPNPQLKAFAPGMEPRTPCHLHGPDGQPPQNPPNSNPNEPLPNPGKNSNPPANAGRPGQPHPGTYPRPPVQPTPPADLPSPINQP